MIAFVSALDSHQGNMISITVLHTVISTMRCYAHLPITTPITTPSALDV